MDRRQILKFLTVLPIWNLGSQLEAFTTVGPSMKNTDKMPVLFLGHGSPMNAIEENEFVRGFRELSKDIPKPRAILCISAHWETSGTRVTAMDMPRTIHDFNGFPQELYKVQYPAPGDPELARETYQLVKKTEVLLDKSWGLDHGAWSVIKHMYPEADIPIVQMSLDHRKAPRYHYELAEELAPLRQKGVLIVGSGNIVHNLRMVAWDKLDEPGYGFDWALEANSKVKQLILNDNHEALIEYAAQGNEFRLAIPTPEHYLPLLYALALKGRRDQLSFFNDKPVGGSLTMTSVKVAE